MNQIQHGGDGYVINVNEAIGGIPAVSRYSNNYRPIFNGELLQNGGYTSKNVYVHDIIRQQKGGKSLTQFYAIREVAHQLKSLDTNSLLEITTHIFLDHVQKKTTSSNSRKQYGGYLNEIREVLVPLGRNNLLVLAALLLIHYFAKEYHTSSSTSTIPLKGGNNMIQSLHHLVSSLGINQEGSSNLLLSIQDGFISSKKSECKQCKTAPKQKECKQCKTAPKQKGGNMLKNLIAPLGTNAFIATGLLILLEKVISNKIKEKKTNQKIGGKKMEELFNVISPLSFHSFGTMSFLETLSSNQK